MSLYEWSAGADQAAAAELAYPSLANSLATGTREKARAAFFMDVSCRRVDVVGSTGMDWSLERAVYVRRRRRRGRPITQARPGHRWLRAARTRKSRLMGGPKSTGWCIAFLKTKLCLTDPDTSGLYIYYVIQDRTEAANRYLSDEVHICVPSKAKEKSVGKGNHLLHETIIKM
jgi:hypothetical protein